MSQLTRKEIDLFSKKILEDYDANNPSTIFKDKMKINISDALIIQSTVTKLREKRGEEVIGFKIGCVLKETQKKMGFTQPAWGTLWKNELHYLLRARNHEEPLREIQGYEFLLEDI